MLTLIQRVKLKELKALYGYDLATSGGMIDRQNDEEVLESLTVFHISGLISEVLNDNTKFLDQEGMAFALVAAAKSVFSGLSLLDKESGLANQARVMILSELEQALGETNDRSKGGGAPRAD